MARDYLKEFLDRLADSFRELNELQLEGERGRDCQRSESMARQIVWRELLELELHEIDERIAKIAGGR